MGPKQCPRCRLLSPPEALRCDCGHLFEPQREVPAGAPGAPPAEKRSRILVCPVCGLLSPPIAQRCDCGYVFGQPPTTRKPPQSEPPSRPKRSPHADLMHHYALLGVSPKESDVAPKSAWRKLVSEYHPDKVATLGPELRELAEQKTKQINGAYRAIMERRGLGGGG